MISYTVPLRPRSPQRTAAGPGWRHGAPRMANFAWWKDLEPDAVMAVLWRQPEVKSFLRKTRASFVRRAYGARKILSPPMILEVKGRTVAEVLDRIAAAYRQDPPRVWVYQE